MGKSGNGVSLLVEQGPGQIKIRSSVSKFGE